MTEAIGAYYLLVENGVAKDGFEATAAPAFSFTVWPASTAGAAADK